LSISGGHFDVEGKKHRIDQISNLESQPEFWDDNRKATQIQLEKKRLEEVYQAYVGVNSLLDDAEVLLELHEGEGGLDESALSEIFDYYLKAETKTRDVELKKMLSGERDAGDAYLVIHAGAGGTEACDWAGILARMYTRYANACDFKVEEMDFTEGDGAGYRSITFQISGPYAYGYLRAEAGVHRLVRISPFDSNARRHTSFASVYAYPVVDDDIEIEIDMEEVRVDTYRASGAGGQHVNKTDSAVRMTHKPSGIVVQCQAERSQIQNRARALKMLKARLFELEEEKRQAELDKENAEKKKIEWGSQIRNYVLQPYQLIKDVRTGHENSNVDRVLDGDLQSFIEAYLIKSSEDKD
jgi:peptide chain release factor 2